MPEYFGNILVVTQEELLPFWPSLNALRAEIDRKKDKPYGLNRVQVGGNGRKLLIEFDSLEKEIQSKIGDPRKQDNILESYYNEDPEALIFYNEFQFPNGSYLLDKQKKQYIINANVAAAILKLQVARENEITSKGGSTCGMLTTIHNDSVLFNNTLQIKYKCQHTLPKTYRHWRRAITEFNDKSFISLIKDVEGKTLQNARKVDEKLEQLLNELFTSQTHKPTATEIAWQYQAFLNSTLDIYDKDGVLFKPNEFTKISSRTVKSYLAKWENQISNYAKRSGDRQVLRQKFIPHHSLLKPKHAGSLISIDDRNPPFNYMSVREVIQKNGKKKIIRIKKRVWFYLAIDLASEAIVCWVHGESKEGLIIDFYKQLARNYHQWGVEMPDGLECESSLNSSFKQSFLKNGAMFQNVRIEANNARGKRIEAYFKPLRYGLEKKREGWIARPFAKSESNQSGPEKDIILEYDEIVKGCLQDIRTWNNTEHSIEKGMSRFDFFLRKQHPRLKPTNYRSFIPEFNKKTVTSCNAGIVRFRESEWFLAQEDFIVTDEALIELMKKVEGETFDVYWLDANDGSIIRAYVYMNGRYICQIMPKPLYARAVIERTPQCDMNNEIVTRYAQTIEGFQTSSKKALNKVGVIDNRKLTINNHFDIEGLDKQDQEYLNTDVEILDEQEELVYHFPHDDTPEDEQWKKAF